MEDKKIFIAPGAHVLGDVRMGEHVSIWYNAVVRADDNTIRIGKFTNVQDNCTLHLDPGGALEIGEGVTIGHNAIVHGCTIGDNALIGMGSILMNGSVIGRNCIVGAGALVTEGKVFPDNSLLMGSPAKVVRQVTAEEIERIRMSALHYAKEAEQYMKHRKYLFFDLDGTLKGESRKVTEKTRQALSDLRSRGHKVFLCSGRTPEFLKLTIGKEIDVDGIVGCAGGSVLLNDTCIFENAIPKARLAELIDFFESHNMDYSLETTVGSFRTPGQIAVMDNIFAERKKRDPEGWKTMMQEENCGAYMDIEEMPADVNVQKIVFLLYDQAAAKAFAKFIERDFHIVYFIQMETLEFGEIIPKTATKARGIQAVLEKFGAGTEDAIGFGDSMNDYQMMDYVGTAVVREDACEALRALGDYFFIDPDQDGIAKALEDLTRDGLL